MNWPTIKAKLRKYRFRIMLGVISGLGLLLLLLSRFFGSKEDPALRKWKNSQKAKGLEAELQVLELETATAKKKAEAAEKVLNQRKEELAPQIKKWEAARIAKEFRERGY